MIQNNIVRPEPQNHTLSLDNLRILAELLARDRDAELVTAYGVAPDGEQIDLLHPARCATGARV